MKSKGTRLFLAIFLIIILLVVACLALLLASFFGGGFDTTFIIIVCLLLSVWLMLWALRVFNPRVIKYMFWGMVLCSVIAICSYNWYDNYIDSIPVVSDREVDLSAYQPFAENTKAVSLDGISSLKLTDSLPRIDGATALYPLYAAFVQATYPQKEYDLYESEIGGGTTPKAYRRLLDGEVDMIFCAAPSKEQVEEAAKIGKTFNMIPIGKEAFVFFVNKENPVRELTVAQIQDIYSGKVTNWKEVGGKIQDIRAFQRPKNSGSQTMLEKIMEGKELMVAPHNDVVGGMGGIIEETAEYKNFSNAIGYSFLFFVVGMKNNDQIQLLKVNGVYPERKNIENGEYPFTGDFYAITTDTENKNVPLFIEWILSDEGQLLVEKTGYTPLKNDTATH